MATRGKKSLAALAVLPVVPLCGRPEPLSHLNLLEAKEWNSIVQKMPASFFSDEMLPMLGALCQHIVAARKISAMIEQMGDVMVGDISAVDQLDKMLKMRERENKAIASFSTKLRLTPQSRYQPSTAAAKTSNQSAASKPWEFGKTA